MTGQKKSTHKVDSNKDKEWQALYFNVFEQRHLEKKVRLIDLEAELSIRGMKLKSKKVEEKYQRFKEEVTKIRSNLSARQLKQIQCEEKIEKEKRKQFLRRNSMRRRIPRSYNAPGHATDEDNNTLPEVILHYPLDRRRSSISSHTAPPSRRNFQMNNLVSERPSEVKGPPTKDSENHLSVIKPPPTTHRKSLFNSHSRGFVSFDNDVIEESEEEEEVTGPNPFISQNWSLRRRRLIGREQLARHNFDSYKRQFYGLCRPLSVRHRMDDPYVRYTHDDGSGSERNELIRSWSAVQTGRDNQEGDTKAIAKHKLQMMKKELLTALNMF